MTDGAGDCEDTRPIYDLKLPAIGAEGRRIDCDATVSMAVAESVHSNSKANVLNVLLLLTHCYTNF